jgi:hypothetical protein
MQSRGRSSEKERVFEEVLGYLNFSSGAADPRFLASLNVIFEQAMQAGGEPPVWERAWGLLEGELRRLSAASQAFRDTDQATAVLSIIRQRILPEYLEFHRDLLFHQDPQVLFNSFFVGRACEAVLRQGPSWAETDRIQGAAIRLLNDYIGHRPVAVLESQKIEPYDHERIRPVPLYISAAGVAVGPYREVVEATMRLLAETDEDILRDAYFDPDLLDELAFDPRAYDFDHPVNKRPNYHFGQWDPHHIDNRGCYRRFVIQQVTLDSLVKRLDDTPSLPRDELLFEAAAVMAGTVIMSTGVSGAGPDTHDSSVTLATLLPRIASYRDTFYERLLARIEGRHGERLRREAEKRRQPFGGARQHLNAELARRRAAQLEHVHLAAIYARMGYPDAAIREANVVPASAPRTMCQIDCRLTEGEQAAQAGDLPRAATLLEEIMDWVRRGVECGAIVDPWNILGFDANFSLFPALENSVRDHRVDELVALMEEVFTLYSRVWSEAAASDDQPLYERISAQFHTTALWWRKYAAHEVSGVEAIDAQDAYGAAQRVAEALNLWHKGGAAVEDVRFWAPHADMFDSPRAYALVIRALLERGDFVASMGLIIHWLSRVERIGLECGDTSFFEIAEQWMLELRRRQRQDEPALGGDAWKLACKFLDYLEANAEEYWEPPAFELDEPRSVGSGESTRKTEGDIEEDEVDQDDELYQAAYEDVVYRDSTDDGIDSELVEYGQPSDDELLAESRRLVERLSFLSTVSRLRQIAVAIAVRQQQIGGPLRDVVARWIEHAARNRLRLRELIDAISAFRLPTPTGAHDSMVEYDRIRMIRESIAEQVIVTSVDTADAMRILSTAAYDDGSMPLGADDAVELGEDTPKAMAVFSALLQGNPKAVRAGWDALVRSLQKYPLLYVPLAKGGDPHSIVAARTRQRAIQDLLAWLPRQGLLVESCQLIEVAREMERKNPVGPGAVTEFDELFKIGYKSLVRAVVRSASTWEGNSGRTGNSTATALVEYLKQLTQSLLSSWLAHSKTLRLSVLEKAKGRREWSKLATFIENYGSDLFTQRFLNLANLRAILYEGTEDWLRQLGLETEPEVAAHLLQDLEAGKITFRQAAEHLSVILEAIIENYGEYRDYNSMTTQSDRGELLYMLLDFLRLRTNYDRICWQLKPVVWAHEILVREGHALAAEKWRRELADQTREEADAFIQKLARLQNKYAMRMPTVADRLGERFIRPMVIDRIRALAKPAMDEAHRSKDCPSFRLLQKEIEVLTREPTGVGLDVPAWLVALEEEVGSLAQKTSEKDHTRELDAMIPRTTLSLDETRRQLDACSRRIRT